MWGILIKACTNVAKRNKTFILMLIPSTTSTNLIDIFTRREIKK